MSKFVGQSVKRKEDTRLLTGAGKYVADLRMENMLEAAFLRSTYGHARIKGIEVDAAKSLEGVYAVITSNDIEGKIKPIKQFDSHCILPPNLIEEIDPVINYNFEDVLAKGKVTYAGQPVVVVVAKNRYIAEDALALLKVEYEPLEALVDPFEAAKENAPIIQEHMESNIQSHFLVQVGDVDRAIEEADYVLKKRLRTPRLSSSPMETRGVLANYDAVTEKFRVWSSTQLPYEVRSTIASLLEIPEESIHVTAPEVGGGFGPKGGVHPEEILVPYLSRMLGRPIRWIEDRLEHLTAARQSRDQTHDVEVSYKKDGTITGIKDDFIVDSGAVNYFALTCAYNTAYHLRGMYKIPSYQSKCRVILTNKTPNVPFRGAGRPEATFVMDRVIDMIARNLAMDPVDVMKKNMIQAEEMPYDQGILVKDGAQLIYDSGNYPDALDKVLEAANYEGFRKKQQELKEMGKYVGIGISSFIEGTGSGPFESALVKIDLTGHVTAHLGSSPQGQGHETVFSQICADDLGITLDQVTVIVGDTGVLPLGAGTYASRSAVNAGSAIHAASQKLRKKVLEIAGIMLSKEVETLLIENGSIYAHDNPEKKLTFVDIANAARPSKSSKLPEGMEAGLQVLHYFVPPTVTFASSIHVAQVEVDKETGFVKIQDYSIVHDCGTVINPMIVEGQVQGGIAQGIGSALYEEIVHDNNGQVLTGSYMDYLIPTSMEIPTVKMVHQEYPSTRNPMGIKGVGEGGAISPPAAIANAVVDALTPLSIEITKVPVSPGYLRELIKEAERV